MTQLSITKAHTGAYRWTLVSSSAYRDSDGEIVSTAALAADVARADRDGDYGPLVWWHVYQPLAVKEDDQFVYAALELGRCDYNAMTGPGGRFLVESGIFHDPQVAHTCAQAQDRLGVSIQFTYEPEDLDDEHVFHRIRRRERSLLPTSRAANLFTKFIMSTQEQTMNQQKYQEFLALFDSPDAGHAALMAAGKQMQQAAATAAAHGIASKEADTGAAPLSAQAQVESPIPPLAPQTVQQTDVDSVSASLEDRDTDAAPDVTGEMGMTEFAGFVSKQVGDAVTTVFAPLQSELTALVNTQQAIAQAHELAYTNINEQLTTLADNMRQLQEQYQRLDGENDALHQQVKALKEGVPAMANLDSVRASQQKETVIHDDHQLNGHHPHIDPLIKNTFGF